jgi:hypothetical protein
VTAILQDLAVPGLERIGQKTPFNEIRQLFFPVQYVAESIPYLGFIQII